MEFLCTYIIWLFVELTNVIHYIGSRFILKTIRYFWATPYKRYKPPNNNIQFGSKTIKGTSNEMKEEEYIFLWLYNMPTVSRNFIVLTFSSKYYSF